MTDSIPEPQHDLKDLRAALDQAELEISKLKQKLQLQATHNDITGLPNRHTLMDRLQQTIQNSDRYQTPFALLFMDLDAFQAINDGYGHTVGDQLLKKVGARLKSQFRRSDTVAHVGRDEFCVLLYKLKDKTDASKVANNILDEFASPFVLDSLDEETPIIISASIGIAIYPENGIDGDKLLDSANHAMHTVKKRGKNNFHYAA